MKKVAVLMFVAVVFFANSSPVLGCEICEKIRDLGFYNNQVREFITDNAASHDLKARQMLYLFEHKYSQRQVGIILGMSGVERRLRLIIPDSKLTYTQRAETSKPKQQVVNIAEVRFQQTPQQIAKVEVPRQQEPAEKTPTPWTIPVKSNNDEQVQVIEATMDDAAVLMNPMEQQTQSVQKEVASTNQQIKQVEAKKQYWKQKYVDAGVTTSAIVTGLAIPPPAGPLVAAGIILTRVGWGLFQKDPH